MSRGGGRAIELRGTFSERDRLMQRLKRPLHAVLPDSVALVLFYRKANGRFPRIFPPASFTDKVLWRAAFDRRPILAQLSDKARAREYVIASLGAEAVPKLHFSTTLPRTIPFDALPRRFVVKPTHASGWVALVRDRSRLDEAALIESCEQWLRRSYYALSREWVYKDAAPRIHVEEFIGDDGIDAPHDYKIFVFAGAAFMVQVDVGRFTKLRRAFYSRDWRKLDARMAVEPMLEAALRPPFLDDMLEVAERLGEGFDFLRVDCLASSTRFYVNELSVTPGRGLCPFQPASFDLELGARWQLPPRASARAGRLAPSAAP
jgi:hypothetical protein